jgi:hypothetical protein
MKEVKENEPVQTIALDQLRAEDFQPYLGHDFIIRFTPDSWVTAQLEQVLELTGYSTLERKPFSLLLQTDLKKNYYLQAIYILEHPAHGSLSIFLVPVGIKEKGVQYEAVFS